jgi:hypothetical protein
MVSSFVTTVVVTVNNQPWSAVRSLRDSGLSDSVYTLNPETGTIEFGDGINGAKPPVGSTIGVSYSYGGGSAGNISKGIDDAADVTKFWVVVGENHQALGWGDRSLARW